MSAEEARQHVGKQVLCLSPQRGPFTVRKVSKGGKVLLDGHWRRRVPPSTIVPYQR
jgi:hypothetical protein